MCSRVSQALVWLSRPKDSEMAGERKVAGKKRESEAGAANGKTERKELISSAEEAYRPPTACHRTSVCIHP